MAANFGDEATDWAAPEGETLFSLGDPEEGLAPWGLYVAVI
jgi:hypothetical protein